MMRPHDHKPDHTTTHFYSRTGWVPFVGYGPRHLHTLEGCHAPCPHQHRNEPFQKPPTPAPAALGSVCWIA